MRAHPKQLMWGQGMQMLGVHVSCHAEWLDFKCSSTMPFAQHPVIRGTKPVHQTKRDILVHIEACFA